MARHWYHAPRTAVEFQPVETRTRVYSNVDDEEPLHVYAYNDDGIVLIEQGGDRIAIPHEDIGQFLDALETLLVTAEPERSARDATTEDQKESARSSPPDGGADSDPRPPLAAPPVEGGATVTVSKVGAAPMGG